MTTMPTRRGIYDKEGIEAAAQEVFARTIEVGKRLFRDADPDWWKDRSCMVLRVGPVDLAQYDGLGFTKLLGGPGPNYPSRGRYLGNAKEKEARLRQAFLGHGHRASALTRDPDNGKYGGAVVVNLFGIETIFAPSGIPEAGDEAVALLTAERLDPEQLLVDQCFDIAEETGNEIYAPLRLAITGLEARQVGAWGW